MSILTDIKSLINHQREKIFWDNPNNYNVAVILDENGEYVYGKVKKGLARLERIPKPETGYNYFDIVTVKGPTGSRMFRDYEIDEYKATGIYKKSKILTFTYNIILQDPKEYFRLLYWFEEHGQKAEIPWSSSENNFEWRKGYCTASDLEQAKRLLYDFINKDNSRKVKDIK